MNLQRLAWDDDYGYSPLSDTLRDSNYCSAAETSGERERASTVASEVTDPCWISSRLMVQIQILPKSYPNTNRAFPPTNIYKYGEYKSSYPHHRHQSICLKAKGLTTLSFGRSLAVTTISFIRFLLPFVSGADVRGDEWPLYAESGEYQAYAIAPLRDLRLPS